MVPAPSNIASQDAFSLMDIDLNISTLADQILNQSVNYKQIITSIKYECINPNNKLVDLIIAIINHPVPDKLITQEKVTELITNFSNQENFVYTHLLEKHPTQFGRLITLILTERKREEILSHVIIASVKWDQLFVQICQSSETNDLTQSEIQDFIYHVLPVLLPSQENKLFRECLKSLQPRDLVQLFMPIYRFEIQAWIHFFKKYLKFAKEKSFETHIGQLLEYIPDSNEGSQQNALVQEIVEVMESEEWCDYWREHLPQLSLPCQVKFMSVMSSETQQEILYDYECLDSYLYIVESLVMKKTRFEERRSLFEALTTGLKSKRKCRQFFQRLDELDSVLIPYLFAGLDPVPFEHFFELRNVHLKTSLLKKAEKNMEVLVKNVEYYANSIGFLQSVYESFFFEINSMELNDPSQPIPVYSEQDEDNVLWNPPINSYVMKSIYDLLTPAESYSRNEVENYLTYYQLTIPEIPALMIGMALVYQAQSYKVFWKMATHLTREQFFVLCRLTPNEAILPLMKPLREESKHRHLNCLIQSFTLEQLRLYVLDRAPELIKTTQDFCTKLIQLLSKLSLHDRVTSFKDKHYAFFKKYHPEFMNGQAEPLIINYSTLNASNLSVGTTDTSSPMMLKEQDIDDCKRDLYQLAGNVLVMTTSEWHAFNTQLKKLDSQIDIDLQEIKLLLSCFNIFEEWTCLQRQPNIISSKIEEFEYQIKGDIEDEDPYDQIHEGFWQLLRPRTLDKLKLDNIHSLTLVGIKKDSDLEHILIFKENQNILDCMTERIRSLVVKKRASGVVLSEEERKEAEKIQTEWQDRMALLLNLDFVYGGIDFTHALSKCMEYLDLEMKSLIELYPICFNLCQDIQKLKHISQEDMLAIKNLEKKLQGFTEADYHLCREIIELSLHIIKYANTLTRLKSYLFQDMKNEKRSEKEQMSLAKIWDNFHKYQIHSISDLFTCGHIVDPNQIFKLRKLEIKKRKLNNSDT